MKARYMINREATKLWKRSAKRARLIIAVHDGKVLIVTEACAFELPAYGSVWDDLVRPAIDMDMPENGRAYSWHKGQMVLTDAADTVKMVKSLVDKATEPAKRTPFMIDTPGGEAACHVYKSGNGKFAVINEAFDMMINHDCVGGVYMNTEIAPAVLVGSQMTVAILPIRAYWLKREIEEVFG